MSETVIRVENLSKSFRVGHLSSHRRGGYETLRETMARGASNFLRQAADMARGREIVQGDEVEEFWALKDVTFEVKRGEVLGIIGRNGAGKSTLLKILSRITEPTKGRVTLHGRVASLLEVGTGFHPELTGRENVFLNGAILGMTQREVRKKFDEIVAFAEVEKFLDTPVKRYSSGMYVRLAFAVAANLEPEILIVDEVLAVGDAEFQKKCLGKLKDVSTLGRTVLFVSHNLAAIRSLCNRGIVLDSGAVHSDGPVTRAILAYTSRYESLELQWDRPSSLPISGIGYEHLSLSLRGEQPSLKLLCTVTIRCCNQSSPAMIAFDIRDSLSQVIMQALPHPEPFIPGGPGINSLVVEVQLPPLIPGVYQVDLWLGPHYDSTTDYVRGAATFEIVDSPTAGRTYPYALDHGAITPISTIVKIERELN